MSVIWTFSAELHSAKDFQSEDKTEFSQKNALKHLKVISSEPHYVGAAYHRNVREYLVTELQKLGLEVETFEHVAVHPLGMSAANTQNIITKIKGSGKGKALALVSHYDSGVNSSLGASDAGSGVVTILEGIRAFLANGQQPLNDIIIVITDGEETGLLGASAFVDFHPWSKDIGLVLNFEARGSGGSSYMLIETNGGNKKMIEAFAETGANTPVASSLMYALYKSLPNDTDLTAFREQGDIEGFNFAFIGDHFDYHTAQDSYERIDRESLNHQADYLMTSLSYFAFTDLSQLKSDEDMVYFNFPGLKMVIYPSSWVTPMVILAFLLFLLITFIGLKKNTLSVKGMLIGFVPLVVSLLTAGSVGYFGWQLLLIVFPQYADIMQGYTYNGHWIVACLVSMTGAITLLIYQLFNKRFSSQDLFFAPLVLWLVINIMIALKLPSAGFYCIPLLLALACFALNNVKDMAKSTLSLVTTLLALPALMMLTPWISVIVIGLGLKTLFIATILTCLVLLLLVPVFCNYQVKKRLIAGLSLVSLVCLIISALQSDYTEDRKKPTSVSYVYDLDNNLAFMVSFNKNLDEFSRQFFDEKSTTAPWDTSVYPDNGYFGYYKPTSPLALQAAKVEVLKDELTADSRTITLLISPQRPTNMVQLASINEMFIRKISVNDEVFKHEKEIVAKKVDGEIFVKYVLSSPMEQIKLQLTVDNSTPLSLKVYGTSFDLFDHIEGFNARGPAYMPSPFSLNDATVIGQSVKLNYNY